MDQLFDRIAALTGEQAMEAALALSGEFEGEAGEATRYLAEVEQSPYAHVQEVDDLARLVLVTAAVDPALRPSAEEAVNGVGKRAFIFGGAEIVALATLGVFVYALVKSGGKASTKRKIEIKPDGTVTIEEEIVYVAGSGVMKTLLGAIGQ